MILIADDHEDTRRLLVRLLQSYGYEAVAVACGVEALRFLQTHKPCLALLDYEMPHLNGLAVFREMKRDPSLRDIPVIMFSAHSGDARDEAIREGVDAYVLKASLDWERLQREILRLAGPGTASAGRVAMPKLPRSCAG